MFLVLVPRLLGLRVASSSDDSALSRPSPCFVVEEFLGTTLDEVLTGFGSELLPPLFLTAAYSPVDMIVGGS